MKRGEPIPEDWPIHDETLDETIKAVHDDAAECITMRAVDREITRAVQYWRTDEGGESIGTTIMRLSKRAERLAQEVERMRAAEEQRYVEAKPITEVYQPRFVTHATNPNLDHWE